MMKTEKTLKTPLVPASLYSYVNVEFSTMDYQRYALHECQGTDMRIRCPRLLLATTPLNIIFDLKKMTPVQAFRVPGNLTERVKGFHNYVRYIDQFEVYGSVDGRSWVLLSTYRGEKFSDVTDMDFPPARMRWGRMRITKGEVWFTFPFSVLGFVAGTGGRELAPDQAVAWDNVVEHELVDMIMDDLRVPPPRFTIRRPDTTREALVTFADTMLAYGRDRYGNKPTPLFVNILDAHHLRIPGTRRRNHPEQRPQDYVPGGAEFLSGCELVPFLEGISELTGKAEYREAADSYVKYFANHCVVPETGYFAWGTHAAWDVFRDCPLYLYPYHEYFNWTKLWLLERLWQANPQNTERALDAIKYHCLSATNYFFNRHGTINEPIYLGEWMERLKRDHYQGTPEVIDFCHMASAYFVAWAFLYKKTGKAEYLERSRQMQNYYWDRRDPRNNLFSYAFHYNGKTRIISTFFTIPFIANLLDLGEILKDDEWGKESLRRAELILKSLLALPRDLGQDYIAWKETMERNPEPIKLWSRGGRNHYRPVSVMRLLLKSAVVLNNQPGLELVEQVMQRYLTLPMPTADDSIGGLITADVIGLGVDLCEITGNKAYFEYTERLVNQSLSIYWKNGLFSVTPRDDYYSTECGGPDLARQILRFVNLQEKGSAK